MRLYTTQRKIDADARNHSEASFRRIRTANPLTIEFEQAYNMALAFDNNRTRSIIKKRLQRLQKSKSWLGYKQFRDNGVQRIPRGFLWMRRLEELAGFATENVMEETARQVHDVTL